MTTIARPHAPQTMSSLVGYKAPTALNGAPTVESTEPSGCDLHPTQSEERAACMADFRHFLNHWCFKNREGTGVLRFNNLWEGQEHIAQVMQDHPWCYFLKAGKLGFTELECAFDGWTLMRVQNARVHLFSLDGTAAKALLVIVKFGLTHLPAWMQLDILSGEPGGDTTTQLRLYGGLDDERTLLSFAATKDAAINLSAHHSHVDEMARMPWPADTWSSVESTVAPGGTVHIVTRGAGDGNFTSELWYKAKAGDSPLHPHFEPWDARPRVPVGEVPEGVDPSEVWYRERSDSMLPHQLNWLAPATEDDALKGSSEGAYINEPAWLACYDPDLPPLLPGDMTPLVLGMDAGVTNDLFAIVAVSRHPKVEADPAIRAVMVWYPPKNGEIDYDDVERWIRVVCWGGCVNGHPNAPGNTMSNGMMCSVHPEQRHLHRLTTEPAYTCGEDGVPCEMCATGNRVARFNVQQIAYDAYQLVDMAQRLQRDRIAWCEKFGQGDARMEADANLRMMVITRRLRHANFPVLNEHIRNANAKITAGEDTKLRIVKRNPGSKIDLAVASSMAVSRVLYLNLHNSGAA